MKNSNIKNVFELFKESTEAAKAKPPCEIPAKQRNKPKGENLAMDRRGYWVVKLAPKATSFSTAPTREQYQQDMERRRVMSKTAI